MSNVQASIGFFLLSSVCTAIASKQKRKRGKRIHEKYKMSTSDQTRNEIERDFIKLKRLYTYTYRTLCIHLKLMLSPPSSFISKRENKIKMIWCYGWWVNGRSVLCFGKWARFLFFSFFCACWFSPFILFRPNFIKNSRARTHFQDRQFCKRVHEMDAI